MIHKLIERIMREWKVSFLLYSWQYRDKNSYLSGASGTTVIWVWNTVNLRDLCCGWGDSFDWVRCEGITFYLKFTPNELICTFRNKLITVADEIWKLGGVALVEEISKSELLNEIWFHQTFVEPLYCPKYMVAFWHFNVLVATPLSPMRRLLVSTTQRCEVFKAYRNAFFRSCETPLLIFWLPIK